VKKNWRNLQFLSALYQGTEGMGWHSDARRKTKKNGAIASVSFGAERKFT
jgi:alkylated DNA repair dioxygenase AlkB